MTIFIQLGVLDISPIGNPNQSDGSLLKAAVVGNMARGPVSSQALKRALRRALPHNPVPTVTNNPEIDTNE